MGSRRCMSDLQSEAIVIMPAVNDVYCMIYEDTSSMTVVCSRNQANGGDVESSR